MNYCCHCGARVVLRIPPGDDRPRYVCKQCRCVHYENPKLVVGCIPVWQDKILLCRRAIEPRYGWWTLPAGYLENNETVQQGAAREVLEEAGAEVVDLAPYILINIASISQIYLMFRAKLCNPHFQSGIESLEVQLFPLNEIPWEQLAFPSIRKTLQYFMKDLAAGTFQFHLTDISPQEDWEERQG